MRAVLKDRLDRNEISVAMVIDREMIARFGDDLQGYSACVLCSALRYAARWPAAQGRDSLAAFAARLKSCPDTCLEVDAGS
jgi:hypothetical protein